jgi:hypothetical protein
MNCIRFCVVCFRIVRVWDLPISSTPIGGKIYTLNEVEVLNIQLLNTKIKNKSVFFI